MRIVAIITMVLLSFISAKADVSKKEAKKAIATSMGMSLPTAAVRIERITSSSNASVEISAQLELVFRLARGEDNQWRLRELRTADARWEDVDLLTQALKLDLQNEKCESPRNEFGRVKAEDLSIKQARCLVANLFAVELPSDAVRIKEVTGLGLGSEPSALAVTLVQADFRLAREAGSWRADEIHTGARGWVALGSVTTDVETQKRAMTTEQLNVIAAALDTFRRDRGSFVVSDKHSVLIDNLTPHYLSRVLRLDAWHRPFHYQGESSHFTLRSLGPDGKENTPDDIVVTR